MVRQFECFIKDCYIGKLYISEEEKRFVPENQENYTTAAKNFIKYMPLSSTSDIDAFINERVIEDGRPDKSVWVTMAGLSPNASDLEIFIGNKGRGLNDNFNMRESEF